MGVNKLCSLLYPDRHGYVKVDQIDNLIIDGNNLIHVIGSRNISVLKRLYPVTDININLLKKNGIRLSPIDQIYKMLELCVEDIIGFITGMKELYKMKNIIIMTDPRQNIYTVTRESIIKSVGDKHVEAIIEDPSIQIVALNIKENEQSIRQRRSNFDIAIEQLRIEISESDFIKYSQYLYFLDNNALIRLSSYIYSKIVSLLPEVMIYISQAEADISIRLMAKEMEEMGESLLVISTDSDYHVLLSDVKQAFIKNIFSVDRRIYNPYTQWINLFGDKFSYSLVCRIAVLLGNDYVTHNYIVGTNNAWESINKLFNLKGSYRDLLGGRARNVKKLATSIQQILSTDSERVYDITVIDDAMKLYNENYYIGYIRSIVVYSDYELFGKYIPLKQIELDDAVTSLMTRIYNFISKWSQKNILINETEYIAIESVSELSQLFHDREGEDSSDTPSINNIFSNFIS